MIKNYLITTLRNFVRHKSYSLINVVGLSIGVTACIVIYLLISYELSFDKFHSKYDNIYRVVEQSSRAGRTDFSGAVPYPLTPAFRNDFPDIPLVTAIDYHDEVLMKVGTEKRRVSNVIFADSLFSDVFDFQFLSGNPKVELGQPGKVFLTKSLADKIMHGKEHVTIKLDNELQLEVAGIVADPPATSHLSFSMIVSFPSLTTDFMNGLGIDEWGITASGFTYFVLPSHLSSASVDKRLQAFIKKYEPSKEGQDKYLVEPLSDIHFSRVYTQTPGAVPNGNISNLIVLAVLGVFILAIACVNFINLSTALAMKKSKEIGVRKTLGATRSQLTFYFLGETFFIIVLSLLLSLCAAELLQIWINGFMGKQLDMDITGDLSLIAFLSGLVVVATLLSGYYPAAILSGFNPDTVLRNKVSAHGSSSGVRKGLVVFQFTIAQILIIGTVIVSNQVAYFREKPLGFDKEAIINIPIPDNKVALLESFRTRLQSVPGVGAISFSLGGPTAENQFGTGSFITANGKDTEFDIDMKPADLFYKDVYGLHLKAGRWFTEAEERSANAGGEDATHVYVVNEAYVKKAGFSDAEQILGKMITTGLGDINAEVIGVVEDFHDQSLHGEIRPTVLISFPFFYYNAGVRISPKAFNEAGNSIQKAFEDVFPEFEYQYEFMDQFLAKLYRDEEQTYTLFRIFAGVSIFIGCLGLYGLISFMANQKLKEVGIRKVLGASVESIVMLFGREFVKLIFIAFLIASPITWYFMRSWLNGFAYRAPIQWTAFAVGIGATLLVALITVGYRSIRSALANPVEALRSE
jgi:putative ABC transport system permease protein